MRVKFCNRLETRVCWVVGYPGPRAVVQTWRTPTNLGTSSGKLYCLPASLLRLTSEKYRRSVKSWWTLKMFVLSSPGPRWRGSHPGQARWVLLQAEAQASLGSGRRRPVPCSWALDYMPWMTEGICGVRGTSLNDAGRLGVQAWQDMDVCASKHYITYSCYLWPEYLYTQAGF